MDENHPKIKSKVMWDNDTFMVFICACLSELRKGNRPGTHFNKIGWRNLENTMKEKTGKDFGKKQLSNKWDNMKKDWKLYDRLMRLETGIGGTRSLIDASPEWWDEKIKADKDFAKFKGANLDIYETHYAPLFRDSVAVGDQAMAPPQYQNNSNPADMVEGSGDSDEINLGEETLFPSFMQSGTGKRKKSMASRRKRSTKSRSSAFEEKLDVVLEALSSKSTQTYPPVDASPTVDDCMKIVVTFPGFNEGTLKYSQSLAILTKRQNRLSFMYPTTHEAKLGFLEFLMRQ